MNHTLSIIEKKKPEIMRIFERFKNEPSKSGILTLPFILEAEGSLYLIIVVGDSIQNRIHTFICEQEHPLPEEEKEELLDLICFFGSEYDDAIMDAFISDANRLLPELHLIPYSWSCHTLFHVHDCMTHQGVAELLWKANLNWLAFDSDFFRDLKSEATNLPSIFEVHLKILRICNDPDLSLLLRTRRKRRRLDNIYMKYRNLICQNGMNISQYRYLDEQMKMHQDSPNKSTYRMLGTMDKFEYRRFRLYQRHRSQLPDFQFLFPESPGSYKELVHFDEISRAVIRDKNELPQKEPFLFQQGQKADQLYGYCDAQFCLRSPKRYLDLLEASVEHRNCLHTYFSRLADGKTSVLFAVSPYIPEQIVFTIEIKNRKIIQAYQSYNRPLTEKQMSWLRRYAANMNLSFMK